MKKLLASAVLIILTSSQWTLAQGDKSESDTSNQQLHLRSVERRAVEAAIWGMPAVNYQRMLDAAVANGARANQVVYWSRPVNWKNQTLTPNPDTIYINPFYDTSVGPLVLEIPAADEHNVIVGSIDNAWQNALEDVGPAGMDKGKGGKYLITPPGYQEKVPEGYYALPSDTLRGFVILRSNFKSRSDTDIYSAVEYGKRVKMYPLDSTTKATTYVDCYDKLFDSTIPYDASFYETLDHFVQAEPWLLRDKAMIETLKSIGIERGKPFIPSRETKAILERAVQEARAYITMNYEAGFDPPFYPGGHWAVPLSKETLEGLPSMFAAPSSYPIDGRAVMYSIAYFSAKHLGAGQFYLLAIHDKAGQRLDGSKSYRLKVPANVPVKQYWSVTAYSLQTHALIRDTSRSSLASNTDGVVKNSDGSVDVYFGPIPPVGKEANWVPTDPKGQFELLFRFYGPEQSFFEKKWTLPDVQPVD